MLIKVLCVQAVGGCLGYQVVFVSYSCFDPGNEMSFKIGHVIVFSLKYSKFINKISTQEFLG